MTEDRLAKSAVEGLDLSDIIGVDTPVAKISGYPFPGVVRSSFFTTKGDLRYVIEATGTEYAGMLHIFSPTQIAAV